MAMNLWVGEVDDPNSDDVFELGSALTYNDFLNFCGERDDLPEMIWFTPGISIALPQHKGVHQLEVFSVKELLREVGRLITESQEEDGNIPLYVSDIAIVWRTALDVSISKDLPLSLY